MQALNVQDLYMSSIYCWMSVWCFSVTGMAVLLALMVDVHVCDSQFFSVMYHIVL